MKRTTRVVYYPSTRGSPSVAADRYRACIDVVIAFYVMRAIGGSASAH